MTTVGYIRSLRERVTIDILSYQLWMQSKGKSITWFHHIAPFRMEYLLLGWSRSGVGAGIGVDIFRPESELESESLKSRRLRSPASDY